MLPESCRQYLVTSFSRKLVFRYYVRYEEESVNVKTTEGGGGGGGGGGRGRGGTRCEPGHRAPWLTGALAGGGGGRGTRYEPGH